VNTLDRRVSVVIPVRNGERYLAEALESILGQSTSPGEVVVVDDGSTDATPSVLERYSAHVRGVRQSPAGVAAALNHGIALAHGTLLAFLDADDVWLPDSLRCRVTRIDAADEPDAVFGRMQQFATPISTRHASPVSASIRRHATSHCSGRCSCERARLRGSARSIRAIRLLRTSTGCRERARSAYGQPKCPKS